MFIFQHYLPTETGLLSSLVLLLSVNWNINSQFAIRSKFLLFLKCSSAKV